MNADATMEVMNRVTVVLSSLCVLYRHMGRALVIGLVFFFTNWKGQRNYPRCNIGGTFFWGAALLRARTRSPKPLNPALQNNCIAMGPTVSETT
jgi:hypothetical protein